MQRAVTLLVAITLLACPAFATTVKGKVSKNKEMLWAAYLNDPGGGAQVTVTLHWDKKSADLMVAVLCDIGIIETFGIGSCTNMDRVQRIEAGVIGTMCGFGVGSLKGSSSFTLSVLDARDPSLQKMSGGNASHGTGLSLLVPMAVDDWPQAAEEMRRLLTELRK